MKRRAISLLLAACMMCGLLTVGASAASSDGDRRGGDYEGAGNYGGR